MFPGFSLPCMSTFSTQKSGYKGKERRVPGHALAGAGRSCGKSLELSSSPSLGTGTSSCPMFLLTPEAGSHCSSAFCQSIMLHLVICMLNPADNCFHSSLSPRKGASLLRDGEAIISHSFFILKHFKIEISRFGNVVSVKVLISISCLKGCEEWFFFDREILKPELNQLN